MEQQSLKMQKNQDIGMKKIISSIFLGSIIMLILLNFASACNYNLFCEAGEQYSNCPTDCDYLNTPNSNLLNNGGTEGTTIFEYQKFLADNLTLSKYSSITYAPSNYDTIKAGSPLQFYVWYHGDVVDWNLANTNNTVQYCSLRIDISKGSSLLNLNQTVQDNSTLYTIFEQNFTDNFQNRKYFVSLYPLDSAYVYTDCKFLNPQSRPKRFIMPMDESIVTPTQECVACQYYAWAKDQVESNQAKNLGGYTTDNLGYIGGFVLHFYELLVIAFWVLMILLVVLAVGLIIFAMYVGIKWMAKYVR